MKSSKHLFIFSLNLTDDKPFGKFFRVRLDGLRVWLVGAQSREESTTVEILIETSGAYNDRNERSEPFPSTTLPLQRMFQYQLHGTSNGRIICESAIRQNAYLRPTPFTQWTITLLNPEDLDLTGLTSVRLEWVGSGYYRSMYNRQEAADVLNGSEFKGEVATE